jgi:hypothetical protein
MNSAHVDRMVASARIVPPERAATSIEEFLLMRIFIGLGKEAGFPVHVVKFADGVTGVVMFIDPADHKAWESALRKTYVAGAAGHVGPLELGGNTK